MKAEWPKASMNKMSFSYPAVTNKSFITHRRDILFIFLAKERRFAFANLERSTLEHSSYYTHTDFTTRTSPPRICLSDWHMDLKHGFDHGLKDIVADEGRMAESFDE